MVEHIILLPKLFDGVTVVDLRKLTFTYAERLKVAHNFCKDTNLAGRDWLEWFMRRNRGISLRRPQARGGVGWNRLGQDRDQWRDVVSAVMNLRVLASRS
jgi:hypothetical protein